MFFFYFTGSEVDCRFGGSSNSRQKATSVPYGMDITLAQLLISLHDFPYLKIENHFIMEHCIFLRNHWLSTGRG